MIILNKINYEIYLLINLLMSDEIRKKFNIKKDTIKLFKFTLVNLRNS
jgi:hypothetical protein